MLFKELNECYDVDFLLTRRLTQDCIENVFSVVRSKGGNNVNPDASKFNSSMRMLICNHLLTPSKGGNCEIDASQFLTKLHEIKMVDLKMKTTVNETHQVNDKKNENYIHSLMDNLLSPTNIQSILMDEHNSSAVAYVTGWVCSTLEHSECIDKIAKRKSKDYSVTYSQDNIFIDIKSYENSDMLYPLDATIDYSKRITSLFNSNIEQLLLESKTNIKSRMIKLIEIVCIRTLHICQTCKSKFIEKLLNVLINAYVKHFNNTTVQHYKVKTKNNKLKKIAHL